MSINPFDDGGTSFVWGDEEAQHSPVGGRVGGAASKRAKAHVLDYIEQNWTDNGRSVYSRGWQGTPGLIR